jgi:large subunit ribosomal protein L24
MKIVKGDTVYIRAGKDVAGADILPKDALNRPMAEQVAEANRIKREKGDLYGEVLRVMPKEGKVIVKGKNMVTKHQRPRSTGGAAMVQQGGRIQKEAPIPISRVMLVCSNCQKPTRVGLHSKQIERDTLTGKKTTLIRERVCKKCGEVIPRPTEMSGSA